jgi:hypothetical protein
MFPQQPQQQFRTAGADVQIFYGSADDAIPKLTWNKPAGVSHVYMLLIGPGGTGDGATSGGGSGAVSVWYGAAQNVPDNLSILVGIQGTPTVIYQRNSGGLTQLVRANSATVSGGATTVANQFTASGFYQSVAGQDGTSAGVPTTTFLTAGRASGAITSAYGYETGVVNASGYFQLQPIIVGVAGTGASLTPSVTKGGIGCGGGLNGLGGSGMVLIASW